MLQRIDCEEVMQVRELCSVPVAGSLTGELQMQGLLGSRICPVR